MIQGSSCYHYLHTHPSCVPKTAKRRLLTRSLGGNEEFPIRVKLWWDCLAKFDCIYNNTGLGPLYINGFSRHDVSTKGISSNSYACSKMLPSKTTLCWKFSAPKLSWQSKFNPSHPQLYASWISRLDFCHILRHWVASWIRPWSHFALFSSWLLVYQLSTTGLLTSYSQYGLSIFDSKICL